MAVAGSDVQRLVETLSFTCNYCNIVFHFNRTDDADGGRRAAAEAALKQVQAYFYLHRSSQFEEATGFQSALLLIISQSEGAIHIRQVRDVHESHELSVARRLYFVSRTSSRSNGIWWREKKDAYRLKIALSSRQIFLKL